MNLHTAEVVHWVALGVMGIVYTTRILWLLKFKAAKDRSAPGGNGRTSAMDGAYYSLANVAMPWSMESTRQGFFFYVTFVLFHLGVVAGISLAFLSTLLPAFVAHPLISALFTGLLGMAFLVGVGRLVRRLTVPHMRLISTPDDFFSLVMLIAWFGLGTYTQAGIGGYIGPLSASAMPLYLYLTSFFLLYVPFSKISHYLYYPFTRWYLGKALGHRGSFPVMRG